MQYGLSIIPVDNFGTVVGENRTYGILALWAVNGLSIVYWDLLTKYGILLSVESDHYHVYQMSITWHVRIWIF